MKGRALRRALATSEVVRINSNVPKITDTTELVTPKEAEELLKHNQHNRPINWRRVEEYADTMRRGEWKLQPQGIILDDTGNILTGQTRLWAVVYSDTAVYLRISRGSPADVANVIDRGRPQSARDLSSRQTERKHSPTEASIARCVCVLRGQTKPSTDAIAAVMAEKNAILSGILKSCTGMKKTKALLMILGAIAESRSASLSNAQVFADQLERDLLPYSAESCWGRGVSFGMALRKAMAIVEGAK